ncbi:MAG TPA: amidase [Segeticoccus sp.]|uniref:amidase n=1 Tax=Segeticoccus sp. TaxID=2706531 RepID=UPI002D7E3EAA|nr:amidase [Segeticoccus sp.]HET8599213.1 amidase [Segeticoccus sp.]
MDELCDLPAVEQAALLRRGAVSARELLQRHLDRIERVNPKVNAIPTLVSDAALDAARAADERQASGQRLGPLHGLPFAVKDTHETQGIRTTWGSPLFADHVPERDELVVARIRAAGAVILGKTNVPEFAAGSHTFNPVFGTTRNPYDLDRSAGGSSGGAAAALATGMTALAEGSDMGGSLRNPASFCNVVGLRPSPGRVATWPSRTPWQTMSVQGPMGRTVTDAALLLSVLAGPDPRDPISLTEPGASFAAPLDRDLTGLRLAWSPDLGGTVRTASCVVEALAPQVSVFTELGCHVEEASPDFTDAEEVFRTLRAWQFLLAFGPLVEAHPESVKESIRWNVSVGRDLTGEDLARAEVAHGALFHRVREFFEHYDALLLPVSQVAPFPAELEYPTEIDGEPQATYLDWMRSAYFVSATGCPALSVPAAFAPDGLPIGLQVVGPHRAERLVLEIAHAFEQATSASKRRPVL